ncbi:MAG: gamma-glutamyltransferase family protein [SAR202 cluster bacterium]|nr:gamma-glutamyltransferase family protein [SAR202 cluster bacterium]
MTSRRGRVQVEQSTATRPATGRPVVYATQGIISSGHYLTSMAGMKMLLAGGNAFDALVAATFAAAVIEPTASYSLGAESVFIFHDARSGEVLTLSGQGVAPAKATVDFYRSKGLDSIPTGPGKQAHLGLAVPGVVDALFSLLEKYGTRTAGEVLAPSIEYADRGFPHYEYMIEALKTLGARDVWKNYPPGGADIFLDKGDWPSPGTWLVQKGLANTLKLMADAEAGTPGHPDRIGGIRAARDAFYEGPIARALVKAAKAVGSPLEMDDLAGYRSKFEQPAKTTYAGYEIYGQGPWTQGPVLFQALNILEQFDLRALGHNTPKYIHVVAEALKLALADREAYYGDPDFAVVPMDGLLSKKYAAERARLINMDKPWPELPPAGDPWKHSSMKKPSGTAPAGPKGQRSAKGGGDGARQGTTHIAVLDRDGNMACSTPSGGSFAKSVFFPELGFAPSTRIEMFNFIEGHPNVLARGKRPRTTLINYIASRNGIPVMTFGCPGGDHQVQGNLQIMLNTFVFGMNPQEAIEAPRFATDSVTNSFYPHVYLPGQLSAEDGIDQETVYELKVMGHKVVRAAVCGLGATITRRDPETGILSAGADPRRACYAIGW